MPLNCFHRIVVRLPIIAVIFSLAMAANAASAEDFPSGEEAIYRALLANIAAVRGDNARAASLFIALGEALQDPRLLRDATEQAIRSRRVPLALRAARKWSGLGGGIPARQSLAEILILSGDLESAKPHLQHLVREDGESPADLYAQLARSGSKKSALEFMREMKNEFAEDTQAEFYFYLAELSVLADDKNSAVAALARARELRPGWAEPIFAAARAAYSQGDTAGAMRELESVADVPIAHAVYAFQLYLNPESGDWRSVLDNQDNFADDAAYNAGRFFEDAENSSQAKYHYEKVPSDSGFYPYARVGLARLLENSGDGDGAMAILLAVEIDDPDGFAIVAVATADLIKRREGAEAAYQWFDKPRSRFPDEKGMLYQHSIYAEEAGRIAQTERLLRRMIELYPDDPDGWNALGYILTDHNLRLDEAQELILRALQIRPDDPNILDSMGWSHYRLGNLEDARKFLAAAATRSNAPEIAAHLGEVLWESGDAEAAKKIWKNALAAHPQNDVLGETVARYRLFE